MEDRLVPATVTGAAWYDTNANGVFDAAESPAESVGVVLTESAGGSQMTTTTDAYGRFAFTGPLAGVHTVQFSTVQGFKPSLLSSTTTTVDIQTTDQEIGLGLIPTGDGSGSGTGSGTGSPDTPPGDAGEGLSGEADSSWDDDGVGTGADDDGGNSCQEGPTFPTPAPPPVPPTGTTLQWNNFRVVATSPVGGDEDAQITYTRRWVSGYEITTRSPTVEIGPLYSASATVTLYDITYSAEFNAARSWVVNGKQTDRLLEHERLHLRIGEYITQKIAARYPYLEGRGQAIGDTRQAAESAARAQAKLALAARVKQMEDEWTRIDTAVQTRYDTQTDHGQDFVNQFAWGMEYRDDVDKEFGGRR